MFSTGCRIAGSVLAMDGEEDTSGAAASGLVTAAFRGHSKYHAAAPTIAVSTAAAARPGLRRDLAGS